MEENQNPSQRIDPLNEMPFIVYAMADGSCVLGEYEFVTSTEWWDDRDEEVRLIKRTYRLISQEEVVLPDPYPIEAADAE
jgi:hypothetical protein